MIQLKTLNDIAKEYFNSSKAKDIDRLESRYNIHFENNLGKKRHYRYILR